MIRAIAFGILVGLFATVAGPVDAEDETQAGTAFAVKSFEVVGERDVPQACFTFDGRLERSSDIRYEDYVVVLPTVSPVVTVRDRALCIEGLRHGTTYSVTLRQGLPGADGAALESPVAYDVSVPNRSPSLAFRGGGYILPRVGPEGLPLRTINVERAAVEILRINDRSLVEQIYRERVAKPLTAWEVGDVASRSGERIWQGEMAIGNVPNTAVMTAFPIDAVIGTLEPGVYIAVAEDADARTEDWQSKATQWFVVSDIGLTTFAGDDGLLVFVRSLATAEPMAGVALHLIARNNAELARAVSSVDGIVRFDPGSIRGTDGNAAQALFAYGAGNDFNFLDLAAPGVDLSDRGVGGREAPGPLDAMLHTERGIYRPGETVYLTALLRDTAAVAVPDLPLTLKLLRPDGLEVERRVLNDQGEGSYEAQIDLPAAAYTGQWSASLHVDPEAEPVGRVDFLVEDFVPPRLAFDVTADASVLDGAAPVVLTIEAQYLYGAPAGELPGESTMVLRKAERPFPNFADFRFGLEQEEFLPRRAELPGFTTDAQGRARIDVVLDADPDTTHPLEAVVRATVFDVGGRPVGRDITLPVRHQPFAIGIRPRFSGDAVPEGATAGFDIVAVGPDGTTLDRPGLAYELFEEDYDYVWYEADGRWDYEPVVRDRRLTGGSVDLTAEAPFVIEEPVMSGRYRLEVFDPQGGIATSVRFAAGWWVSPTANDRPDAVEVTVTPDRLSEGQTATVHVRPPYRSNVLIAVAGRRIHRTIVREIGPEGDTFEIPVEPGWSAGVYVIATAFAPADAATATPPRRAIGLSWMALDTADRELSVAIDAPEEVRPRQRISVPVTVTGAEPGETAYVTLAAVDEAILQLTGYDAPDPIAYYLGKRRLAVELRDIYGRLIDPSGAVMGRIGSGGDTAGIARQVEGLPQRSSKVVSLFSGILRVEEDGTASVPLDLPDFNGRLRLMATAWTAAKVGSGEGAIVVRDPVVAELSLPRFLAPGDRASVAIALDPLESVAGDYTVRLNVDGPLSLIGDETHIFTLKRGQKGRIDRELIADAVGQARITLDLTGPEGLTVRREWAIAVRPGNPLVTRRVISRMAPGGSLTLTSDLIAGLKPETASVAISVGTLPEFDVPGLLLALDRYPYGCAEQITSRALPLLYVNELATTLGLATDAALDDVIRTAIGTVLTLQRFDGAFALWSPRSGSDLWLTPYVLDFLLRARAAGHPVPELALTKGLGWIKGVLDNAWIEPPELPARAYGYYVLARAQAIDLADVRYFREAQWANLPTDLARAQVAGALALLGDRQGTQEAFAALGAPRILLTGMRDYGSDIRDRAAVLSIMVESEVVPRDRIMDLAQSLADDIADARALSTQEQAWTLLAAHALSGFAGEASLSVDGRAQTRDRPYYARLDAASMPHIIANEGTQPLHQVLTVTGVGLEPQPAEANGFRIERKILDLDGAPVDLNAVAQNTMLVVILEGAALEPREHQALIVDLLPAGFEIENVRLANSAQLGDLSWLGDLSAANHVDFRDDRFVAAVDLDERTPGFRVVYLVRAVTPGAFQMPGAFIEDMYAPYLFARGDAGRVTVSPR